MRAPTLRRWPVAGCLAATGLAALFFGIAAPGGGPRGPLADDEAAAKASTVTASVAAPPPLAGARHGAPERAAPAPTATARPEPAAGPPPVAEAPLARRLAVTVHVVDVTTDAPVEGARWTSDRLPSSPDPDAARPTFASGETVAFASDADVLAQLGLAPADLPAGFCDLGVEPTVRIGRRATEFEVHWPVAPEADVFVAFTVAGAPPPPAWPLDDVGLSASVPGFRWQRTGTREAGGFRLPRVPALRHADLTVTAYSLPDEGRPLAATRVSLGPDPRRPVRVVVDLPATIEGEALGLSGASGVRGGVFTGRGRRPAGPWGGAKGSVVAHVTERDGRPAVGAFAAAIPTGADAAARYGAWSGTTDAYGTLRVDALPVGTYVMRLAEPGLVASEVPFEVTPSAWTTVDVREGEPVSLEVFVRHADGTPATGAELDVSPSIGVWMDFDGARQRVRPRIGADGRRLVGGLPAGRTRVEARFGDRRVEQTVDVRPGVAARVELTVPAS